MFTFLFYIWLLLTVLFGSYAVFTIALYAVYRFTGGKRGLLAWFNAMSKEGKI